MTNSQIAKTGHDSAVIQTGRDTQIGFSADDVNSIIETLGRQLPQLAAIASNIVEARLEHFRKTLLAKMEDRENARVDAFADPDFQFLVGRAQYAYARSGDAQTEDVLVDLIAQRSMEKSRTRLALTINEAIDRAAVLTANEFAELSLLYLLKQTEWSRTKSVGELCNNLATFAGPLLPNVSREQSSYSYLIAQSCGYLEVTSPKLMDIIRAIYGGVISLGAPAEDFARDLGDDFQTRYPGLVVPCINDNKKFQLNASNKEMFREKMEQSDLKDKVNNLWSIHEKTMMNEKEFIQRARPHFSEVDTLFDLWNSTPLRRMKLTSIGTAIGYANLRRIRGFKADISIWIT